MKSSRRRQAAWFQLAAIADAILAALLRVVERCVRRLLKSGKLATIRWKHGDAHTDTEC